jgi:threonine aldolase
MIVDFRSDTVTKPTRPMLEAMNNAPVGDDVFGEDPSINGLEEYAANLFGMEKAIFCPSGTMTNQIAIKCHTQAGDEVICDELSHVYQYEGGGIAFNSGASVKLLYGDKGRITAPLVEQNIQPDDIHRPVSSLVVVENTSNRGGGSCYEFTELEKIGKLCKDKNLAFHIDGARLFNALVAKKESPVQYGKLFDSISICLSKGLGAPVGSLLLGKQDFIKKARRVRKVFGGGMRQAGSLAAAGLFALENHVERLQTDHDHATQLNAMLTTLPFIKEILPVETNIIIAECNSDFDLLGWQSRMKENGIHFYAISKNKFRLVTHLDITPDMITHFEKTIKSTY